ncbi:MAG: NCS2 family permease [Oscillospiraceae bacterium]
MEKFFKLKAKNSTAKTEIIAGITTFMTMAYVLVIQPSAIVGFGPVESITDSSGLIISKAAIVISCALISGFITILMAFYTNLPFALSTGMGSNFMFGALIQSGNLSLAQVMSMVLVTGLIFLSLSVLGIRDLIVRMIPKNIKISIGASIGFFIAYLGFKSTGIGSFVDGISIGDFRNPKVICAVIGLIIIAILTAHKIKGALLYGIIATTLIGIPMGVTNLPNQFVTLPSSENLGNIVFNFDFKGILKAESIVLMFIAFFGDFFSTLGTIIGVAGKANMLDENGNLNGIEKPFLVDALGTCVGSLAGCTTITTFVESSSGVEAGGKTGLTSLTVGLLFLIMIPFTPLILMIPDAATGPALIFVGFLMIQGLKNIDFSDFTESFGPFIMIMFGTFMGSIAAGISAGILAYVIIKVSTGKFKDVHPSMYILSVPLILYFIFNKPL